MERRLLTRKQAGQYIGMSESWVCARIRSGELKAVRLGVAVRVDINELNRWIDAQPAVVESPVIGSDADLMREEAAGPDSSRG